MLYVSFYYMVNSKQWEHRSSLSELLINVIKYHLHIKFEHLITYKKIQTICT